MNEDRAFQIVVIGVGLVPIALTFALLFMR
jgi:hypothetical protein